MKIRKLVLAVAALGVVAYSVEVVRVLRPFVAVTPHGTTSCQRIEADGLLGAEDLEFDHASGTLWIAAADRRGDPSFRPHDAAVFRFRPDSEPRPVRVPTTGLSAPLRLHGLGLYAPTAGPRRLFLVNHGDSGESVEIFEEDAGSLRHVRSVHDPLFISLNDVAALGPESFYATNDHGRPPRWGHLFEDFTFRSNASVVYFDGSAARTVQGGLRYANGIYADPDGRHVLVAETTAGRLSVFSRQGDGGLVRVARADLGTAPDNLARDEHGDYWLAAHPSNLRFLRHAKDPRNVAPSQVLRFRLAPDGTPTAIETVLLDDGRAFSGSSVAAAHGDRWLVVGGVFDRGILLCRR